MTEYRPKRDRRAGSRTARSRSAAPPARSRSASPASKRAAASQPRKPKPAAKKRRPARRIVRTAVWVLIALALATVVVGIAGCAALNASLPDPTTAKARGRDQSSVILDAKGRLITRLYAEQNRRDKPLSKMPSALRQAVVATEDQRYYEHAGVDPMGIARALFSDVILGRKAQGGSTITQQYVKNAFGSPEKTLKRKVSEALLANKLEKHYSKDQILELYLNTIYFGHGAYGVESASQVYFGKSVEQLTLPECAMLAGVIKSPGKYSLNPSKCARSALRRSSASMSENRPLRRKSFTAISRHMGRTG